MQINEVFGNVPTIIGNFLSRIYCVNKDEDVLYELEYTGKTLNIVAKKSYSELTSLLGQYEGLIEDIENNDKLKKILSDKVIYSEELLGYKVILISEVEQFNDVQNDKFTLLIADDSPVITKFFTKTFESDFNILVAKNGDEAINLIEKNKDNRLFVGAFIDLQMPVKSGYEVLEYLSTNNLLEIIPTSVISGEDSQNGIERATGYGIIDMLQKPFSAEAARSIVDKTIQHSKNYENR